MGFNREVLVKLRYLLLAPILFAPFNAPAVSNAQDSVSKADPRCGSMLPGRVIEIDHSLYFNSAEEAANAASRVDAAEFEVEVKQSAIPPEWLMRAVYRELPAEPVLATHEAFFKALASEMRAVEIGGTAHSVSCHVSTGS